MLVSILWWIAIHPIALLIHSIPRTQAFCGIRSVSTCWRTTAAPTTWGRFGFRRTIKRFPRVNLSGNWSIWSARRSGRIGIWCLRLKISKSNNGPWIWLRRLFPTIRFRWGLGPWLPLTLSRRSRRLRIAACNTSPRHIPKFKRRIRWRNWSLLKVIQV